MAMRILSVLYALAVLSNGAVANLPDPGECLPRRVQSLERRQDSCPAPVDETSPPELISATPWTHRPFCIRSTADPKMKFCVFTCNTFGDNGISFITTPELAARSIVALQDKREVHWPEGLSNTSLPYKIVPIPGKGKGVVATRFIPKHETFMLEYANVMADTRFPSSVMRAEGYMLLQTAARQLVDPEYVLDQARSSKSGMADAMEDVLRTNAYSSDIGGHSHMVLYPVVSRINHGCKPNAFLRYSTHGLRVGVAPFRDIEEGEEFAVSYLPLGLTRKARQHAAQRWGFNCTCDLCSMPPDAVEESDARRRRINEIKHEIETNLFKGRSHVPKAIELALEMVQLVEEEDLVPLFNEAYETLAMIYFSIRDLKSAEFYAGKALDIMELYGFLDDSRDRQKDITSILAKLDGLAHGR